MVPPRFLEIGDQVTTRIEGVGEMRNRIVSADRERA
jgi:2-keto-4-pentenoate hydratase/2-oxohepta-3-ene-1,7-dioic acid hydratase in catechol pathway